MPNGDAAAAAGLPLVAATADRRLGYDEINLTRDQLVQRVFPASQIATVPVIKGGTGAITAPDARTALAVPWDATTSALKFTNPSFNRLGYEIPGLAFPATLAHLSDIPAATPAPDISGKRDLTDGQFNSVPIYTPHGRANPVSGWLSAGIDASGRIAVTSSSRRFKKQITTWTPDRQAMLAVEIVSFLIRADYNAGADPAEFQYGFIAEQIHDLGLTWLVFYDDEGLPFGIRWERFAIGHHALLQDHEARLAALEARLT